LSALSAADALLEIPVGTQRIEEGASIRVRPL
jgi:molybdopterin biosynthesis enzyme